MATEDKKDLRTIEMVRRSWLEKQPAKIQDEYREMKDRQKFALKKRCKQSPKDFDREMFETRD